MREGIRINPWKAKQERETENRKLIGEMQQINRTLPPPLSVFMQINHSLWSNPPPWPHTSTLQNISAPWSNQSFACLGQHAKACNSLAWSPVDTARQRSQWREATAGSARHTAADLCCKVHCSSRLSSTMEAELKWNICLNNKLQCFRYYKSIFPVRWEQRDRVCVQVTQLPLVQNLFNRCFIFLVRIFNLKAREGNIYWFIYNILLNQVWDHKF
jgi:hypothetical protein